MTQPSNLTLTEREVQYLVAAHAVARAIVGAEVGYVSEAFTQTNVDALLLLHADEHFTPEESNALMDRLRDMLPPNGPVMVISGFPIASSSTLVQ
jgi:cyclopropane fatty-acyl-phospholipid synthase-like methyltransferase